MKCAESGSDSLFGLHIQQALSELLYLVLLGGYITKNIFQTLSLEHFSLFLFHYGLAISRYNKKRLT